MSRDESRFDTRVAMNEESVMDESRFAALSEVLLGRIADLLDNELGDRIDVELESGILTMILPDGGQYVINKHGPMKQIWMSSPVSGAMHFNYVDGEWISTREPHVNLILQLAKELKAGFAADLEELIQLAKGGGKAG